MNSKRARPRTTSLRTHACRRNPTSGVSWDSLFLCFGSEKALVEEMSYHTAMTLIGINTVLIFMVGIVVILLVIIVLLIIIILQTLSPKP